MRLPVRVFDAETMRPIGERDLGAMFHRHPHLGELWHTVVIALLNHGRMVAASADGGAREQVWELLR